jgi:hypothetical protein
MANTYSVLSSFSTSNPSELELGAAYLLWRHYPLLDIFDSSYLPPRFFTFSLLTKILSTISPRVIILNGLRDRTGSGSYHLQVCFVLNLLIFFSFNLSFSLLFFNLPFFFLSYLMVLSKHFTFHIFRWK